MMNLNLLVLGAGASHSAGYPLTNEMVNTLESFANQLPEDKKCGKLKKAAETLVGDMRQSKTSTLDEYARQLLDPSDVDAKNYREKCEPAKRIIAAYFRWFEPLAMTRMGSWKKLIQEILPYNCLRNTTTCSWRVMSFNYDRVFEMAVKETYPEFFYLDRLKHHPRSLNSEPKSLDNILNMYQSELGNLPESPKDDRFTLLKMHGSICYRGSLTPHPTGVNPPQDSWGAGSPLQKQEVCDEFLLPENKEIFEHIAFPWDADTRPTTNKHLTGWCQLMDEAARKLMSRVIQIKVIGYSLPSLNELRFTELIQLATNSCRCVEVIEPSKTLHPKWESFAATYLPKAKRVWRETRFEDAYN